VKIKAVWTYGISRTDADLADMWNDGNPWAEIGVDPASGPPPASPTNDGDYANIAN